MSRGRKIKDLSGKKYGRLFVESFAYLQRNAYWNCICNCGNKKIIQSPSLQSGKTKSCGCLNLEKKIERITKWAKLPYNKKSFNGRVRKDGYIYKRADEHPVKSKEGYVAEHRLVAEKMIGRLLKSKEVVHHWDENPSNNSSENLCIFRNNGAHWKLHLFARRNKISIKKLKFSQDWLYADRTKILSN